MPISQMFLHLLNYLFFGKIYTPIWENTDQLIITCECDILLIWQYIKYSWGIIKKENEKSVVWLREINALE